MTARYSAVNVSGAKNSITNRRYRTRARNGSWGGYVTFPGTINTTTQTFNGTNQTVNLAITGTFDVEFSVSDRFGTTTIVRTVGVGRPIFFIDDVLGSIAMNDFPKDPNTFLLNGALTFAGNLYADTSEGGGAINLNNGDITKANAIFFNDSSNALLEGIHFAKSGITAGSVNPSDYDTFKIVDGKVTLQGEIINEPMNVAVLQNGWSHYSGLNGMYPPASYWKDKNGVVHITGMIGGGSLSSGLRLFSLPAGYRPAQKEIHYMYNPGTTHDHTRVDIFPEGYVQLVYSTNTNTNYIVLSNVSFRAAQ